MSLAKQSLISFALILGVVGFLAAPAHAGIFVFEVPLDGLQEVPPNASPATGFVQVVVDDVTFDIDFLGTFQGLLGNAVAAHLHGPAAPGVNAAVIFPLVASASTSGSITGNATLTAGQVSDVLAGLTYINLHSTVFPGGEIRGQVVPEPASFVLLALGGLMVVGRQRRA